MTYLYSIDILDSLDSSFYEEESKDFLIFYQLYKQWTVYDSFYHDPETVLTLTENFINFHGKINFPDDIPIKEGYWTTVPLGVFRYRMLSDGSWHIIEFSSKDGYIVDGMYWSNGFFYRVKDKDRIIQLKLFVDSDTKFLHSYPDLL